MKKSSMTATRAPMPMVDMTKPRSLRPMMGYDIEQWRGELGLTKYDAQHALGLRNAIHYKHMCSTPLLPVPIEILLRLYDESPMARGWDKFTLKELFELMYRPCLAPFAGTKDEIFAKVDLGARFTKLFDRSSARHYEWLQPDPKKSDSELSTYSDVECILAKLKQMEDPKEALERVAKQVWMLRGVDLDSICPVPTPENPPRRQKTGRKSRKPMGLAPAKSTRPVQVTSKNPSRSEKKRA